MELLLTDGVYTPSPAGGFVTVSGHEETAQRLMMKLAARRGGYAPWPDYGSRLYQLPGGGDPERRLSAARQYAAEALSGEDAVITGISLAPQGDPATLTLWLRLGDGADIELSL